MNHTSERKLHLLIRSLLKRDTAKRCDGRNDIFVISVIDLESSSSNDLRQVLMAPNSYLPIEDQSCVVINEATNSNGSQLAIEPHQSAQQQPNPSVVVDEVSLCDDLSEDREHDSSVEIGTHDQLDYDHYQDQLCEREWSSSSVDSFFCRCNLSNIDTVFPEENAAIPLGERNLNESFKVYTIQPQFVPYVDCGSYHTFLLTDSPE